MLIIKILKAEARAVPDGMTGKTKSRVTVDVMGYVGSLQMPITTILTEDEMTIWNSLDQAVSERLRKLVQS